MRTEHKLALKSTFYCGHFTIVKEKENLCRTLRELGFIRFLRIITINLSAYTGKLPRSCRRPKRKPEAQNYM